MKKVLCQVALCVATIMSFSLTGCASDTNCAPRTVVRQVVVMPPPEPVVVTEYICGKCHCKFTPTAEFPYCPTCVPRCKKGEGAIIMHPYGAVAPAPAPGVVYSQPPAVAYPQSAPSMQQTVIINQAAVDDPNNDPSVVAIRRSVQLQKAKAYSYWIGEGW